MEFSGTGKNENQNLRIAENTELVSLLEKTFASLGVGDLAIGRVLNSLDLDLPSRHFLFSLSDFKTLDPFLSLHSVEEQSVKEPKNQKR